MLYLALTKLHDPERSEPGKKGRKKERKDGPRSLGMIERKIDPPAAASNTLDRR